MKSSAIHNSRCNGSRRFAVSLMLAASVLHVVGARVGGEDRTKAPPDPSRAVSRDILSEVEWRKVEAAVDKGLSFLSQQHRPDGSFQPVPNHDPGISGLCVLAFLSRGHLPGEGPYGEKLNRSIEFLLSCQQSDGLISKERFTWTAQYNHGICALVLTELYGMSPPQDESRFRQVIERALDFTAHRYPQPKHLAHDEGSWRYLHSQKDSDGDVSVTSWSVMFLRSAKNAGFNVDAKLIEEALAYMKRTYDPQRKTFRYNIHAENPATNYPRGMAAAGALSLSLAGEHQSDLAQNAAKYILKRPFDQYERPVAGEEFPCYGAFYCSQAMFHMGGSYWNEFYPRLVKTLQEAQQEDGSWLMQQGKDVQYGPSYMTALTVLALTPPYQVLPILQR